MSTAAYQSAWRKHRHLYGPRRRDTLGAARRLQALAAAGWTFREVAQLTGHRPETLADIAHGRLAHINAPTAQHIADAFAQLAYQPADGPRANRTRNTAAARGWAPAAAWDNIDDPAEQPKGAQRRAPGRHSRDEIAEEYTHLRAAGESDDRIAQRLGLQLGSLHRALGRNAAA